METISTYQGLHNLVAVKNARKKPKRVGRGESSGYGKTSGRGHNGQKSRKSGNVRIGFEGGQNPLSRRLPKIGFNNSKFQKKNYTVLNFNVISPRFKDNDVVDIKSLLCSGLISNPNSKVKLLSSGKLDFKLNFKVHAASKMAIEKIKSNNGKIEIIK